MGLLTFNEVTKTYTEGETPVQAVRAVSFSIPAGQFVAVMGASGSGKSTVLNLVGMLDRPTSGTYTLETTDVSSLSDNAMSEIRCRRIGIVFQSFNLFSQFSVFENVCTPMRYARVPPTAMRDRAHELLDLLGLGHRLTHRPSQLSGGERQRVAIARALANDPPLVLADEPTGNLDEKTGNDVMRILTGLVDSGRTVVMVTHNPAYARIVDRVIRLHDGVIVEDRPGGKPVV
ncbi:MAG: ABC transporter ATP-binding protein [Lentisphaerae bacterium]|nr:ABC transporter ATP-binding protein [Lentisphaerota bacterium]